MGNLSHLATRLFGVPLLIERGKLDVILAVLGPRVGIASEDDAADAQLYGPGDTGKSRKSYYVTEDKIAVIDVVGPLVKRQSGSFLSGGPTTYTEIENEFMDAVTDPEVKGVLLQVDSPGGESVGCFELSDLIHSQRGSKPIFAVADGDAFSAAYALASAADQLYVTKSGGVGSVGVWMAHVDQSAYDEKQGVKVTYVFAGARKVDGNPHEPLSEEAHDTFKALVDRTYGMFVDAVARNRGLDAKAVRKTEAGLFFGEQGTEIGFADHVGTFSDALAGLRAAIARPSNGSSAAVSAAPIQQKKGAGMTDETQADAAKSADVEMQVVVSVVDAEVAKKEILAYAADVSEYCFLAGMSGKAAGYIREAKPIEVLRKELCAARAAEDAETVIHSAVLSETGASVKQEDKTVGALMGAVDEMKGGK